jgi:hypothetical protein
LSLATVQDQFAFVFSFLDDAQYHSHNRECAVNHDSFQKFEVVLDQCAHYSHAKAAPFQAHLTRCVGCTLRPRGLSVSGEGSREMIRLDEMGFLRLAKHPRKERLKTMRQAEDASLSISCQGKMRRLN